MSFAFFTAGVGISLFDRIGGLFSEVDLCFSEYARKVNDMKTVVGSIVAPAKPVQGSMVDLHELLTIHWV
jgi:hypothetical protein